MRLSIWWMARGARFAPRRSAAAAPSAPSSCSVRPPTSSWGLSPAPPPFYLKHDRPGGVSPSREGHPRWSVSAQRRSKCQPHPECQGPAGIRPLALSSKVGLTARLPLLLSGLDSPALQAGSSLEHLSPFPCRHLGRQWAPLYPQRQRRGRQRAWECGQWRWPSGQCGEWETGS